MVEEKGSCRERETERASKVFENFFKPKRDEEDDHEERLDAEEGSGKSIEVEEWLEKEQPSAEEVIDGEEQQDLQEAIGNNEYQEEADESNDQETGEGDWLESLSSHQQQDVKIHLALVHKNIGFLQFENEHPVVPSKLKDSLIKAGLTAFQNNEGELPRGKFENRTQLLTKRWFMKRQTNGEEVTRTWLVYLP